jgi:hypothetical protein
MIFPSKNTKNRVFLIKNKFLTNPISPLQTQKMLKYLVKRVQRAGTRARSLPILLARSLSFAWARTLSVEVIDHKALVEQCG